MPPLKSGPSWGWDGAHGSAKICCMDGCECDWLRKRKRAAGGKEGRRERSIRKLLTAALGRIFRPEEREETERGRREREASYKNSTPNSLLLTFGMPEGGREGGRDQPDRQTESTRILVLIPIPNALIPKTQRPRSIQPKDGLAASRGSGSSSNRGGGLRGITWAGPRFQRLH